MKTWFAAAAICAAAILCPAAENSGAPSLDKLFAGYPETLGTVFDVPVTKAEMFAYYSNAKDVPEWLPQPYLDQQRAAFARAFVELREREIGAKRNGFAATSERARKYLEKQLAAMPEDEQTAELSAVKMSREQYLDKLSADPKIQQQAAEADFMDSLSARHVVTDEDIEKYFKEHIDEFRYNDQEFANFELLNPDGTRIEVKVPDEEPDEFGRKHENREDLRTRSSLDISLLKVLDQLKDNERSGPVNINGQTVIVQKLPLPDPVLRGQRFQLRLRLERERAGDARGTLHEMSKFKLNFEIPEVPEPFF